MESKNMNISIFARPCFLGEDSSIKSGLYPFRLSSRIRGEEIAEYLGAKYNPTSGYENDLCIYVKPRTLDSVKDGSYVDFADGDYLIKLLEDRPKIKVIAISQYSYELLKEKLKNEIVFIPHHHINFEKTLREKKGITTGGYIGKPSSAAYSVNDEIKKRSKEIGLDFITCFNFENRQDAVDFYKQIDFLLIGDFGFYDAYYPFSQPTKMINAASFGIPSIASWRIGYKEFEGNYVQIKNMDELMVELKKFKDENYYNNWSNKIIEESEKYHISRIAELYKQLS
jgi:hypothetical protein